MIYDVIVIGCGPAGIAAGIELQKCSTKPSFLIVEARDRIGGRTYTDRQTFDAAKPIDLGARWIHHFRPENPLSIHHKPSDQDVITRDFVGDRPHIFLDMDGSYLSESLRNEAKLIAENFWTKVQQYPTDQIDVSIREVIREKYNEIQDEQMRRLVDMNIAYVEHYEAANLEQLSAKSFLKTDNNVDTCDLTLPIGLGTFIEQIADQHQLPIQLNTIITNIDIPTNENELICLTTQDNRQYFSKYILITIPLGCLKARSIQFNPSLPDWKQNAIDQMGFGLLNKVYIQFPITFWDEQYESIFIASNRFRFFLCHPEDHILILFLTGRLASKIEQQTDEQIISDIVQFLRAIYPQMPEPIKWLVTRWGQDPFARGSYSNFPVGTTYEITKELARDCYNERVYWAGEHANYGGTIGCVDSAFETGQREAGRILNKLI